LFSVAANLGAQLFKGMAIGSLKPPALPEVADFSARFYKARPAGFDKLNPCHLNVAARLLRI